MSDVGTKKFRQKCIKDIKNFPYDDKENFFERYLGGEDFDKEKLTKMGYKNWEARNISAYINNEHDSHYGSALKWEGL